MKNEGRGVADASDFIIGGEKRDQGKQRLDDQMNETVNHSHDKRKENQSGQPKTEKSEVLNSDSKGFVLFVRICTPTYHWNLLIEEDAILTLGVSRRSGKGREDTERKESP